MNWSDVGKKIVGTLPILAGVLGGPSGQLIGAAVANALGVNNVEEVAAQLSTNPDAWLKLKTFEAENQLELTKIVMTDKADARKREADLAKSGNTDYTTRNLAYLITASFILCIILLFTPMVNLNDAEKNILMMLLGVLTKSFSDVIAYYFGSSLDRTK